MNCINVIKKNVRHRSSFVSRTVLLSFLCLFSCIQVNALPVETKILETEITSFTELDNGVSDMINIGFDFDFYGQTYSTFSVTTDGLLLLGHKIIGGNSAFNTEIPKADSPNSFIAPFWDNLVVSKTGGFTVFSNQSKISYAVIGASPTRKLVVQWTNMIFKDDTPLGTFQAIIYEKDSKIQTQYRVLVDRSTKEKFGQSATIGIENQDGTAGVQYSYLENSLSSEQAISFTPNVGATAYTMDGNAIYDGVILVKDLGLPEPGVPYQVSPAHESLIPTTIELNWNPADNATKYRLLYSTNAGFINYPPIGLTSTEVEITNGESSYTVNGLESGSKYYWMVIAENTTGTTWSQINVFNPSDVPNLVAVPSTNYVAQSSDRTISLHYTGGDESTKTATIESLPTQGKIYQCVNGSKGAEITTISTVVTDPSFKVIYEASGNYGNGAGDFEFGFVDDTYSLVKATATVNVSPPGIPNFTDGAKTTNTIEVTFDRPMADPTGTQSEFSVKETLAGDVENTLVVTAVTSKANDPYTYILTLASPISVDAVHVYTQYTKGTVTSAEGGVLESFDFQLTEKLTQTITFANPGDKVYGTAAFDGAATATSGLAVTYTSSDSSICSVSGTDLVPGNVGTVTITATQLGDDDYAPVRSVQTFDITAAAATVAITDLTYTYDGSGKSATVTTTPGGLSTTVTYDGSAELPTEVGTYTVVATIVDENYEGSNTETLTINKATAPVAITDLTYIYDGTGQSATVTTTPGGLTTTVTYDGSATLPINAGTYTVVATIVDDNYEGTNTDTLTINKATAIVTITNLIWDFDDTTKIVTVTSDPAGLHGPISYNGGPAPSAVGSYEVIASVDDPNYEGSATATMVIKSVLTAAVNIEFYQETIDGDTILSWNVGGEEVVSSFDVYKVVDGVETFWQTIVAEGTEYSLDVTDMDADSWALKATVDGESVAVNVPLSNKDYIQSTIYLDKGWNFLGASGRSEVVTELNKRGMGSFWVWNNDAYEVSSTPALTDAFWVYSDSKNSFSFQTAKNYDTSLPALSAGWNMVSFPSTSVESNSDVTIFGYEDEIYKEVTEDESVEIMSGYWIFNTMM